MSLFDTLAAEAESRNWTEGQQAITELAEIYNGELPARFEKFFPKNQPKHIINLTRLAWDDLATSIGRIPEFRSDPLNESDIELQRVGLHEKIAHSYLRKAEPSAPIFMWTLAWWLLASRAVVVVWPDNENKTPRMAIRDPRTAYPNPKRVAGGMIVELEDIIFKYELPSRTVKAMGMLPAQVETRRGQWEEADMTTVIEYIDANVNVICTNGGTEITEEHNLGIVPAHVFQTFNPNENYGLSHFQDQVQFMVSVSRLMTAKLNFADRLIYPIYWVKGHEGKINLGPHTLNRLSPSGDMGQLTPPVQLQVDQDIAMLERFARILNRNPESRQGEVQQKGTYVGAKTLEQLSEAIDTVIGRYWDIISVGMAHLLKVSFIMDEKLWPEERKSITGNKRGKSCRDKYTPSKDIDGRYFIRVDYGFGLGGYQGFLQHVQANQGGLMSTRRAIEAMPGVSDVDEELRTIELESMDKAGQTAFLQQAAMGQLDMIMWSKLRKEMAEKRRPLADVIFDYQEELQAQAQAAAAQAAQGVGGQPSPLTVAPQPGPEEAPAPEGIPAGMMM